MSLSCFQVLLEILHLERGNQPTKKLVFNNNSSGTAGLLDLFRYILPVPIRQVLPARQAVPVDLPLGREQERHHFLPCAGAYTVQVNVPVSFAPHGHIDLAVVVVRPELRFGHGQTEVVGVDASPVLAVLPGLALAFLAIRVGRVVALAPSSDVAKGELEHLFVFVFFWRRGNRQQSSRDGYLIWMLGRGERRVLGVFNETPASVKCRYHYTV